MFCVNISDVRNEVNGHVKETRKNFSCSQKGCSKYVSSVHGNKIYYTDAFYRAMYDALHAGKNPVEAY